MLCVQELKRKRKEKEMEESENRFQIHLEDRNVNVPIKFTEMATIKIGNIFFV